MAENIKKKVIFAHPAIRPYRKELFEILSREHSCKFIFVEDLDDNLAQLKTAKIPDYKVYPSWSFLFYSKGFTLRLVLDILFGEYDIWVGSGLNHFSTHLAVFLVKLRGKKFILFSEDWWVPERLKNKLFTPLAKLIAKCSDAVVCASEKTQEYFIKLGADKQKLFVGPNATSDYGALSADNLELSKLREKYASGAEFLLLYLGRVVEYKGLDLLIEAVQNCRHKDKIKLLVVGGGDFLEKCKQKVKEEGIKNIEFIPAIKNMEAHYFYKITDLFILPAKFMFKSNVVAEAWGFTVNEALSCGVPVLTTSAVAASELIENAKNGFVVKAGEAKALGEKIDWCFEHKSEFLIMRTEALKVQKKVNPKTQAESFSRAFNYVLYGYH